MRLIEVADVCEILADMYPTDGETVISYKEIDRAYTKVQRLPTVNAASVKHGRWIYPKEELTISGKCSCCGWEAHYYEDDVADMPYCPNCGARMDLEE